MVVAHTKCAVAYTYKMNERNCGEVMEKLDMGNLIKEFNASSEGQQESSRADETAPETSTQEQSTDTAEDTQAQTGPEAESSEEQKSAEDLKDQEKKQADELKSFEEEVPKEFHKNKRWQELYHNLKETRTRLKEMEEKTTSGISDVDDDALLEELKTRGLIDSNEDASESEQNQADTTQPVPPQYDLSNMTPEVKQLYDFVKHVIGSETKPIQERIQTVDQHFAKERMKQVQSQIQSSIKASEEMTAKMGLDWKKEVEPELIRTIKRLEKENPKKLSVVSVEELTREILFPKAIELGKKLASKEQVKINEQKKTKQVESSQESGQEKPIDYSKYKSTGHLIKDLMRMADSDG